MDQDSATQTLATGDFTRQEVFNLCRDDLNFLAAMAMPTVFEHNFPPILLAIWSLLKDKANDNVELVFRLLLAIPRGHAKTTVIKLFVLWLILFTDRKFVLIICATSGKAEDFLADVWGYLAEPNIVNVFGNGHVAAEEDNKSTKIFSFMGRTIVLAAVGQGSVRGINIKNNRPDVIIFDDVQDKENAESETDSVKLLNWMQSTAMKLRSPKRCLFIFIGNKYRVTGNCVCILEKLQKNPLWLSIVTGAILEDGQPLWPELHSLASLYEEFQNDLNMGVPEIFLAELMNDTESNFNALINVDKVPLSPYDEDSWKAMCQGRYIIIDVATNKIGADDTVIGLFGIYPHQDGKERSVLEGIVFGSLSPKETIQKSFELCFRHGANCIGVESVAYQSSLLFWFNEIATEIGIEGISFVELKPKGKKNGRILNFLKQILAGECYLARDVRKVIFQQALGFKPNKTNNTDDILDMSAYWQQTIELYRYLITMPTSVIDQTMAGKLIEDASSF